MNGYQRSSELIELVALNKMDGYQRSSELIELVALNKMSKVLTCT